VVSAPLLSAVHVLELGGGAQTRRVRGDQRQRGQRQNSEAEVKVKIPVASKGQTLPPQKHLTAENLVKTLDLISPRNAPCLKTPTKMFVGAIFCALALPALADDGKVTVEFYGEGL
jgi:hypothetical protein